jgi:hypothetical protein
MAIYDIKLGWRRNPEHKKSVLELTFLPALKNALAKNKALG